MPKLPKNEDQAKEDDVLRRMLSTPPTAHKDEKRPRPKKPPKPNRPMGRPGKVPSTES